MNDIKLMLGRRQLRYYLLATWCIACPILLSILFVSRMIGDMKKPSSYDNYDFPQWTLGVGWTIFIICIIPMPVYYLYQYIQSYHYVRTNPICNVSKQYINRQLVCSIFFTGY